MSVLSDGTIRQMIEAGDIVILPYDPSMLQPASIDIRLGSQFRVLRSGKLQVIDPYIDPDNMELATMREGEAFVLHPADFVLASTFEFIKVPDTHVCRIEGKSSLGRLGTLTHATAGFIDPGFKGHITLELSNLTPMPVLLYPGMKIGQLCFMALDKACELPYGSGAQGSKYQGQEEPTASKYYLNPKPDFAELCRQKDEQFAEYLNVIAEDSVKIIQ